MSCDHLDTPVLPKICIEPILSVKSSTFTYTDLDLNLIVYTKLGKCSLDFQGQLLTPETG